MKCASKMRLQPFETVSMEVDEHRFFMVTSVAPTHNTTVILSTPA
jgi:hypothetical protein